MSTARGGGGGRGEEEAEEEEEEAAEEEAEEEEEEEEPQGHARIFAQGPACHAYQRRGECQYLGGRQLAAAECVALRSRAAA